MSKPITPPPADPAEKPSTPAAAPRPAEIAAKRFTAPQKELQRREVQYQRQRAAVRQQAMVRQRKGR